VSEYRDFNARVLVDAEDDYPTLYFFVPGAHAALSLIHDDEENSSVLELRDEQGTKLETEGFPDTNSIGSLLVRMRDFIRERGGLDKPEESESPSRG